MEVLIGYCGVVCSRCPAYIATKTDDDSLREKTAKEWSTKEYQLSPDMISCHGCNCEDSNVISFCLDCPMRKCGREKNVENCAVCGEYPCNILQEYFKHPRSEEPRKMLKQIRKERGLF